MSNLVKWNVNNTDEEPIQELDSSELPQDPPGYVPSAPEEALQDEFIESLAVSEEEEEQDDADILSNARLRLEQGRLYEMLMTTDVFQNMDADGQAVKNVQREIKRFAKERMEVMLGMKEPAEKNSVVSYAQFNSLEVDILKSLALKLSGGESKKSEPAVKTGPTAPPKNNTLTPISNNTNKTKAAVKALVNKPTAPRPVPQKSVPPTAKKPAELEPPKPIDEMSYDEKLKYNEDKAKMYNSRKTPSPTAIPMPSYDGLNMAYANKAGRMDTGIPALNKIAASLLKS